MRRYAISLLGLSLALSCGGGTDQRGEELGSGDAGASDAGANGDAMASPETGSPDAGSTACVQVEVPDLVTIAEWNEAPDLAVSGATNFTWDVEVDGTRAYLLTQLQIEDGGLLGVLDIADPSNPVLLDVVENLPSEGSLLVTGGHAYVGSFTDYTRAPVHVLDVSTIPVVSEGVWSETGGWPCGAAPNILLAAAEALVVLDATNPDSLRRAGTLGGIGAYDCVAQGNVAYVAGGSEFSIVDLTQPDRPTLLTRSRPTFHHTFSLAVSDDRLYAVGGRGMTVLDVSNPSAPVELGTVDVGDYAELPVVVGRHVYLSGSNPNPALQVVDVSDPIRPMLVASLPMAVGALAASGNTLFVGSGDARLRVLTIQGTRSECLPVPACQSVRCRSLPDASFLSVSGCCAGDTCGLDLAGAAGVVQVPSACVALNQPGEPDPTCPGIQGPALLPDESLPPYETEYLEGCCRPNGLCGLNGYFPRLAVDFGCMDPEGWVPDGTEPAARCLNGADAGQPDPSLEPCPLPSEQFCPLLGCLDIRSDGLACGSCDHACAFNEECRDGVCVPIQCAPGYGACPRLGCTPLQADSENCGACGVTCGPYETCIGGFCTPPACAPSETYCYDLGCLDLDLSADPNHCGGCENVCPMSYECVDGRCTQPMCPTGETFCESWGCVDLQANIDNCGGCDNRCGPYYECNGGTCEPPVCAPRETFCEGSGCVDLQTTWYDCGDCYTSCGPYEDCISGVCTLPECAPNHTFCTNWGACVELSTNPLACGQCSNECGPNSLCVNGVCVYP